MPFPLAGNGYAGPPLRPRLAARESRRTAVAERAGRSRVPRARCHLGAPIPGEAGSCGAGEGAGGDAPAAARQLCGARSLGATLPPASHQHAAGRDARGPTSAAPARSRDGSVRAATTQHPRSHVACCRVTGGPLQTIQDKTVTKCDL
eukprot:6027119-Prymnesium_polylepis.1